MLFPSTLRTSGDWFADFEQLYDRMDELLGGRSAISSIRAVGRAGAVRGLPFCACPGCCVCIAVLFDCGCMV